MAVLWTFSSKRKASRPTISASQGKLSHFTFQKTPPDLKSVQMTPVPAIPTNLPRAAGLRRIPSLTFVLIESVQAMLIQATQLRPGMIVEYNKDLWRIMTITHITPGNWRGMVQTKLRNIKTGSQNEDRVRAEKRVERVIIRQEKVQFL